MGGIAVCAPKNCVAKTRRICYRVFPTTKKGRHFSRPFFVGRGDGITRSHLCLYVRFRLFNAFVVVYAFSFGSSGLYRFAIQTCAPCLLKQEGFAIAFSRQQKRTAFQPSFFVGRGDGITRSYLCLYVRFRLFNAFVVVYAFSFGSSGLYRFAIQTCAPCLLKQEGFAIAFSRQQKKGSISAVLFLLVEVTGFEPTTSWSRTKRATKLRYTSFSFPINLPHREDIVNR